VNTSGFEGLIRRTHEDAMTQSPRMSAPRMSEEQRGFADQEPQPARAEVAVERRDEAIGVPSPQPGDADTMLDQQGWFGNLTHNTVNRRSVQER